MPFIKYTQGTVSEIEEYYQCACYSDEHVIKAMLDREDNQVHLIVGLKKFGFFGRIIPAIKYLFGHECKYGHFDDFIFQIEDVISFRKILELAERNNSKD